MHRLAIPAFLAIFTISTVTAPAARAGWVDDWFNQATYSGTSGFEGQKRGYYTAGNLSARFPHTNDFLATASLPLFKAGCGGIDMFLGGFSFMNMEYLGDKFQRIMTAAPVVAFDMALKALSEQFADEIHSIENITNKLNNLQLDDCKAAKAVVTMASDILTGKTEAAKTEFSNFLTSTGATEFYKKATETLSTTPASAITQTKSSVTGSDADLDKLLYQHGSLLAKAASKYSGEFDTAWIDLVRGYIGDLHMTADNNPLSVKYIGPCTENSWNENYKDFVYGQALYKAEGASVCTTIPDGKKNIADYVKTTMISIAGKTKKGTAVLTPDEQKFINLSPVSIYTTLKILKVSGEETTFIENTSEIVAYAYATKQLKDLMETTNKMLTKYHNDISNKDVQNGLKEQPLADIKTLQSRVEEEIKKLDGKLYDYVNNYNKMTYEFFKKIDNFNNIAKVFLVEKMKLNK